MASSAPSRHVDVQARLREQIAAPMGAAELADALSSALCDLHIEGREVDAIGGSKGSGGAKLAPPPASEAVRAEGAKHASPPGSGGGAGASEGAKSASEGAKHSKASPWADCVYSNTGSADRTFRYLGSCDAKNRPHGFGVELRTEGPLYMGMYREGKRHGACRLEWPDGTRWLGTFVDGVQSDGVLLQPDGSAHVQHRDASGRVIGTPFTAISESATPPESYADWVRVLTRRPR